MKPWGLSKGGALLAMLLLISGALVLPLGARAQGETLWGVVWTDCGLLTERLVSADVTLSDAHAQLPDRLFDAVAGFFEFPPDPGNYILKAKPKGFTQFTNETPPFRFEGTAPMRKDLCVDAMPAKSLWLNLTVLDAQPITADETVVFSESSHTNENLTQAYNPGTDTVRVANRPLVNGSETGELIWFNNTGFTPVIGRPLVRGSEYDYNVSQGFDGYIEIRDPQMQIELENSYFGRLPPTPLGWLLIDYRSSATTSNLQHGQVANETFRRSSAPIVPYNPTLTLDRETGGITIVGNWSFGTDVLSARYDWSGAIGGAKIQIRDLVHRQPISANLTTNSAGKAVSQVWAGTFNVKVDATGYRPVIPQVTVLTHTNLTVYMTRALEIVVIATESGHALKDGLVAIAINTDTGLDSDLRVSRASAAANSNIVRVPVFNGLWDVIVDANGFTAKRDPGILIAGLNRTRVVSLERSPEERVDTTVLIDDLNWSKITVYRKATLLSDSEVPGIGFAGLRDRDYQLSMRFGNGDGSFQSFEDTNFTSYLQASGTFYTVTPKLVTVNGNWYRSNGASLIVNVTTSGTNMTVWTSAEYTLDSQFTVIPQNKQRYYVNVTTVADRNVTHYQNQTFWVEVPRGYEMTSKTTTGSVVTRNFVVVEVDPGIDAQVANPRANLIVDRSIAGVARAKVEGPPGKVFFKVSEPQERYLAWVANDTAIVFSANDTTGGQTTDPATNVKDANFTWTFRTSGGAFLANRYGIWTTYNFGPGGGNFTANVTVTQVNTDNQTYRQINLTVDNNNPIQKLATNRTSSDNPGNLQVKEDIMTRFRGGNSTDLLWGTHSGEIAEWNWDFDSDGTRDRTGRDVDHNYSTPGIFTATFWVVDRVGHRSANQTLPVTVQDTTPPVVHVAILEDLTWREVQQLSEDKLYWFNASRTTDNSLNATADNINLTYTFVWGDGSNNTGPFKPSTSILFGCPCESINVTKTYATHGDWKLSINVTDAAGNRGWLNRTLTIQADRTAHPDLSIVAGTLKITPTSPEEGQQTTFRFNITNVANTPAAENLRVQLALIVRGRDSNKTLTDLRFLTALGADTTSVPPGQNVTVEFKYIFATLGNKTIKITVWDAEEPTQWVDNRNEITTNLVVREAGWRIWAVVGVFLFIIVGIPIIWYVVRKIRAGEMHLPRRRREEGEDEEDEEEEDEDEDEKARVLEQRKAEDRKVEKKRL